MGTKTIAAGCFFAGLLVGAAGTYLYLQQWVNDKIHEEVQAYREKNSEKNKKMKETKNLNTQDRFMKVDNDDIFEEDDFEDETKVGKEVKALVDRYSNTRSNKEGGYNQGGFIQVIPPLEFETFEDNPKYEDYDRVYLTYYADGILVESGSKNIVLDLRSTVGIHFDDHFEDYDDGDGESSTEACYIRNDKRKIFYEIVKDLRTYKKALGKDPNETK